MQYQKCKWIILLIVMMTINIISATAEQFPIDIDLEIDPDEGTVRLTTPDGTSTFSIPDSGKTVHNIQFQKEIDVNTTEVDYQIISDLIFNITPKSLNMTHLVTQCEQQIDESIKAQQDWLTETYLPKQSELDLLTTEAGIAEAKSEECERSYLELKTFFVSLNTTHEEAQVINMRANKSLSWGLIAIIITILATVLLILHDRWNSGGNKIFSGKGKK